VTANARLGVRAYARHRRCAASSVVKAIASGRLRESVTHDRRGPRIDPVVADCEWRDNTDPAKQPLEKHQKPAPRLASDAVAAWLDLADLLVRIEDAVWATLKASHPDGTIDPESRDGKAWGELLDAWREMPAAAVAIRDAIVRHAPLYAADEERR
jgi:hypothetical protein